MFLFILLIAILVIVFITLYAQVVGVPPVPTPKKVLARMIALAEIWPGQRVYDLGCGDGRIVFAAAERGADATGFEISPLVYLWAILRKFFLKKKGRILFRDLLWINLSKADIIFLYLYPTTIKFFLQKKFKRELRRGTKIISYAFDIPSLPLVKKERVVPHGYIFVYQI